uniref:Uncharacterized protein n=1 Tax=Leersia perrieri TaxID=77586 RepID=A0A0D9VFB0_9ORYZ
MREPAMSTTGGSQQLFAYGYIHHLALSPHSRWALPQPPRPTQARTPPRALLSHTRAPLTSILLTLTLNASASPRRLLSRRGGVGAGDCRRGRGGR